MHAITLMRTIFMGLLIVVGIIQFVPVERTNPPVTGDVTAPPAVKAILVRSCYNCHSNTTQWPFYAYIAPVSWTIAGDVNQARSLMNFSRWDTYSDSEKKLFRQRIYHMASNRIMPPGDYLVLHPKARLDSTAIETLKQWAPENETDK